MLWPRHPIFAKPLNGCTLKPLRLRGGDPALARVKLGRIHRAQPFSHYFEAGKYSHYFLAQWAVSPRNEQIEEYEFLRYGHAEQADVGVSGMFGSSMKSSDTNDIAYWAFQQSIGFEGGGVLTTDQTDDHRENAIGALSAPGNEPESMPDTSNAHDPVSEDNHGDHSGNKDDSASGVHSKGGGDSPPQNTKNHRDTATDASEAFNTKS